MKDDAPAPDRIPTKKRQLEQALDAWLHVWLAKPDITYRERKRILAEQGRRKQVRPAVRLALIAGQEGITPHQIRITRDLLERIAPTEVRTVGQVAKLERLLPDDLNVHLDYGNTADVGLARSIVRDSTVVVAYPKEPLKPDKVEGVWDAVRFAKHRNLPVRIVMPDGELKEGSE